MSGRLPPAEPELTPEQLEYLQRQVEEMEALVEWRRYNKLAVFQPYPKQIEHIAKGKTHAERLLMAGNQQGKSEIGAFEMACHLTGDYPDDWTGRVFKEPVRAWAAGETSILARDISQAKLCGTPGVTADFGTGFIPKDRFVGSPTLGHGATGGFDRIQVQHRTNGVVDGVSTLQFKSYEQGRAKFQGATLHIVWMDEQPPLDIYTECLARTTATAGICYVTFTNISGGTEVMGRFIGADADPLKCALTRMTIDDALHITKEMRADIIAKYQPHERDARVYGFPMLGGGKVFTTSIDNIKEPRVDEIPASWVKIWGVDFGIDHPFAAVLLLWDRDNDVIHVHHAFKIKDAKVFQHALMMKSIAPAVPVAWPQDGTQRDRGSLQPLATLYKQQGLRMIAGHATWPDGSVSTEAGVTEMQERFETGRLKVASHLSEFFDEYSTYHREKGLLVKVKDDILSATRVGIMMRRYAQSVGVGSNVKVDRRPGRAIGASDFYFGID